MTQTIQLLRSATAGNAPSSLVTGQMGINEADRALFYRDPGGNVANWRLVDTFLGSGSVANSAGVVLQLPAGWKQFRLRAARALTRATGDDDIYIKLSINAGSTFAASGYRYGYHYIASNTTPWYSYNQSTVDTGIFLGYASKSYTSGFDFVLNRELFSATYVTTGRSRLYHTGTSYVYAFNVGWSYNSTALVNALKILGATGNIDINYAFYGVATG
jgi:hypothetical protein